MGQRISFSNGRRLVNDVVRIAQTVPLASLIADLDLADVNALRRQVRPRLSWSVLFMKAYAKVAAEHQELRSVYLRFPWPHLYLSERNVCLMTFSRDDAGETRLLFGRFSQPETCSLVDLQRTYAAYRNQPIESIRQFQHQIRFASFPFWFRRIVWNLVFNFMPRYRVTNFGTFGMSLSSFKNAFGTSLLGPNTSTLGIDPISRHGQSKLLMTFDHRVLDGKPAFDIIEALTNTLKGSIADELRALAAPPNRTVRNFNRAKSTPNQDVIVRPLRLFNRRTA